MKHIFKLYGEHPSFEKIEEKFNRNQIYSTSLVTITSKCQLKCKMCFTEPKRSLTKNGVFPKETSRDIYKRILTLTKELGGEAIRIVGRGEPHLDKDLNYILDISNELELQVVLFTNGLDITSKRLDDYSKRGNISLMTKIWGNPQIMYKMTGEINYFLNKKVLYQTELGKVFVPEYIKTIMDSGFIIKDKPNSITNFGVEYMITEMNISDLPLYLSFLIENDISPYIRTPYYVKFDDGTDIYSRGVGLPTALQFKEANEEIINLAKKYNLAGSFRQGSDTSHCMRTVYNFVFETKKDGLVVAQPCHHTFKPNIEISQDLTLERFNDDFFNINGYRKLRENIFNLGRFNSETEFNLNSLVEGCICAKKFKR